MKVVFILNSIVNPNSIKRINEFYENGYDVEAYGFSRNLDIANTPNDVSITTIGEFSNSSSYLHRLSIIFKGLTRVLNSTNEKKCIYYIVGLEVALCFRIKNKGARYIYEEADIVHANMTNRVLRTLFERLDLFIIRKSKFSAFRSEGFVKYHFPTLPPSNIVVIPNRLNPRIINYSMIEKTTFNPRKIRFGFVGMIRYESIFNFAQVIGKFFPQHEFHLYGVFIDDYWRTRYSAQPKKDNIFYHGAFCSPNDLPKIYSNIDYVVSTYDVSSENTRYAEPNKIYEAIYFETPIIVSSNTFLAEKVKRLGIGYDVDAMNETKLVDFIKELNAEDFAIRKAGAKAIDKRETLNLNDEFFMEFEKQINY